MYHSRNDQRRHTILDDDGGSGYEVCGCSARATRLPSARAYFSRSRTSSLNHNMNKLVIRQTRLIAHSMMEGYYLFPGCAQRVWRRYAARYFYTLPKQLPRTRSASKLAICR